MYLEQRVITDGRGWSRAVERNYRDMGGNRTIFKPYTQTLNKEARILSEASFVMDNIYFPEGLNIKYREAYNSITEYQRQGKNEHDDFEDNITSVAEELDSTSGIRFA